MIERERALLEIAPADMAKLYRRRSLLPTKLRPLLQESIELIARLRAAAEGDPDSSTFKPLSEPRLVMLEGAGRLWLLAAVETQRALVHDDGEAAGRAGALMARFHATVEKAIGLDVEREVPSLQSYIESATSGAAPPQDTRDAEIAPERTEGDS